MGRFLTRVVAIGLLAALAVGAPAHAADPAYITSAVTWSPPNEADKTITVTMRLTLTPACTPSQMQARGAIPLLQRWCTITPEVVSAIKQDIEQSWSGQQYRCYRLIVDVEVTVDDHPDPNDLTRLIVRVDQSSSNIRSQVSSMGPTGSAWNGATYEDRTLPTNTPSELSTWAYPAEGAENAHLYGHEAGHVLGLEDGYEDVPDPDHAGQTMSQPRAGAPGDLMTNQRNGSVDPSTMDILIGRAGVFRSSPPKCDYQIDTMVTWYHFTSLKCASPDGEWQLTVDGRFDLGGAALVLGGAGTAMLAEDAAGHYTGTWEADFRIDLEGVPASIGGQEGHITGDATFADNTLTLIGTNATGDFWAQTPARSIGGAAGNPSKDFTLPVANDAFCPAP